MTYDVVVIGGGAAGLSGALALTRARRRVLVVDAGEPRNAPAGHVHNYLAREGTPPGELLASGRSEVSGYGGQIVSAAVTGLRRLPAGDFEVALTGQVVRARRLLLATGIVDELPAVPGLAERWGTTVLHCPYCHGWEVRDRAVGILGTGPMAMHGALLWRQWTADVTLFRHTADPLTAAEQSRVDARGIAVVDVPVAAVEGGADVRLADGRLVPRDALVVAPAFRPRGAELVAPLGLAPVPMEMGGTVLGTYLPSGMAGTTAVPGLYVAGNVTDPRAQVIGSAAAGLMAGGAINGDLVEEDTRRAVDGLVPQGAR